jgi:hypothetical protein
MFSGAITPAIKQASACRDCGLGDDDRKLGKARRLLPFLSLSSSHISLALFVPVSMAHCPWRVCFPLSRAHLAWAKGRMLWGRVSIGLFGAIASPDRSGRACLPDLIMVRSAGYTGRAPPALRASTRQLRGMALVTDLDQGAMRPPLASRVSMVGPSGSRVTHVPSSCRESTTHRSSGRYHRE